MRGALPSLKPSEEASISIEWHRDNTEGTAWSATINDGQEGWFEIELELDPDGWRWIINHDRAFWGQERTLG